jgi:hypothetical protein
MAAQGQGDVVIDASNINAVSILRKTTSIAGKSRCWDNKKQSRAERDESRH